MQIYGSPFLCCELKRKQEKVKRGTMKEKQWQMCAAIVWAALQSEPVRYRAIEKLREDAKDFL
jgi:hypothetical protein